MLFLLSLLVTVCVAVPAMHRAPERTIPKANGLYFEFDGEKRYFAGTNAYWLSYLQINSDVDLVLDHMAEAQLRIVRIWGFNDAKVVPTNGSVWFQAFNGTGEPVINTGANGLQRLDYAIRAAETRGIKFIIPFVNNWNDYGGMEAYYPYCVNLNSTTPPNEQWYTNKKCQDQYQKYLKAIVVRHRDSPAVFAWELANEPRCNGCNQTVVTEWARKTSRYIKSLDSKHMVAVGDEGFGLQVNTTAMDSSSEYPYLFQEGTDFAALVALPDIDMGTFHLYPDHWNINLAWGDQWIRNHAEICAKNKKPCLFEEYGVMAEEKCSQETGWQKTSLQTKGVAGDMYWQYGDTLSSGKSPDDKFTMYRGTKNWECMVQVHGKAIQSSRIRA